MVFDAQNGPQLVIRGISTALKMLNLPQKHPFFTFEAKKPLKQRVGAIYPPTKGGLEVCVFIFSFTFLDAALATKTMCTQNLVPSLLYGDSHPSGDVWSFYHDL